LFPNRCLRKVKKKKKNREKKAHRFWPESYVYIT
jgi:hypothetical protein